MEVLIDFGGFYHSVHSDNIDWQIGQDLEWHNDTVEEAEEQSECQWFDTVNWKATYKSYGEEYIWRLNNHFDLDLGFVAIHSPRYYNYTTDKIIVKVGKADEQKLYNYINDEDFLTWADPLLTSRDGFMSFYDGIKGLIEADRYDAHEILIGMVIDYLIWRDSINEEIYDLEYEIIYND